VPITECFYCSPLIFLSTRAAVDARKQHKATLDVALELLEKEGLGGFYSGLSSSLLGIAITNFVYYGFYEKTKEVYAISSAKRRFE
jgi:adenine nucleotide transporter 17